MSSFATGNQPGFQPRRFSSDQQVTWSGRAGQDQVATMPVTIDASSIAAGNSPETTLPAGTILARSQVTGKMHPYVPDANDGRQVPQGILERAQDMLVDGVPTDRLAKMLVLGLVKSRLVPQLDRRAQDLLAERFHFDTDPATLGGRMLATRRVVRQGTNLTLQADDHGTLFVATDEVTFTLPTKQNGLAFRFLQSVDESMMIAGSSDMLARGSASGSAVIFDTGSQRIGSQLLVECVYLGEGNLRWLATNLGGTTLSVL